MPSSLDHSSEQYIHQLGGMLAARTAVAQSLLAADRSHELGDCLLAARVHLGLSRADVATAVEVAEAQVYVLEQGLVVPVQISDLLLQRLALVLAEDFEFLRMLRISHPPRMPLPLGRQVRCCSADTRWESQVAADLRYPWLMRLRGASLSSMAIVLWLALSDQVILWSTLLCDRYRNLLEFLQPIRLSLQKVNFRLTMVRFMPHMRDSCGAHQLFDWTLDWHDAYP
ncbi:MAG: hypothetical protein R2932_26370 [Caldilineaceae bacterium]